MLEHRNGLAIVSVLSSEAILLVLVDPAREHRPAALRAATQPRTHRGPRLSSRDQFARPTCHVLVADDEPHIGRIIKMKLEQGPFRVTLAYDGREALEVLEREPDICLVLLDLMMPHLSGLDVLSAMRADDRWRTLPCIILTAAGQEQQHTSAMAARRQRLPDQAVQPQEAVRAGRRARRDSRRRGDRRQRMSRWAVVLAGGVGSRFWPLSTPSRPKQLLPLVTNEPLLAEAVARLRPIAPPDRVLILTNDTFGAGDREAAARDSRARTSSPSRGRAERRPR